MSENRPFCRGRRWRRGSEAGFLVATASPSAPTAQHTHTQPSQDRITAAPPRGGCVGVVAAEGTGGPNSPLGGPQARPEGQLHRGGTALPPLPSRSACPRHQVTLVWWSYWRRLSASPTTRRQETGCGPPGDGGVRRDAQAAREPGAAQSKRKARERPAPDRRTPLTVSLPAQHQSSIG